MRHGQPAWAKDGKPDLDPALTEVGRRQAELAAERIARRGAAAVVTTSAARAQETAAPIAAKVGAQPEIVADLTEIRLPDWSHFSLHEVAQEFAKAREREPTAWWEGLPGGESFRAFTTRVQRAMEDVLARRGMERIAGDEAPLWSRGPDPGRIVIVGHGGTNAVAATILLGHAVVPWEWERLHLSHGAFLRLTSVPLGRGFIFSLRSSNDCQHLPRDLRTS